MTRTIAALLFSAAVCATTSPALAQSPPVLDADLAVLGLGLIAEMQPVEVDGRPGAEWIVRGGSLAAVDSWVVYPRAPRSGMNGAKDSPGLCLAGPFTVDDGDRFVDVDGDGRVERVRFTVFPQRLTAWALPGGRCLE